MTQVAESVDHSEPRPASAAEDTRYRFLQAALLVLRAGPALILLILVVVVSMTTPIFFTSRNVGNVFSQTAVIAVLALGQLLVIVSRGIDLSVGSTVALSGVVGAIVYMHVQSTVVVIGLEAVRYGSGSVSIDAYWSSVPESCQWIAKCFFLPNSSESGSCAIYDRITAQSSWCCKQTRTESHYSQLPSTSSWWYLQ